MKYKCLVFDHDDTVVDSTRNIHYPSFCEYMKLHRPEIDLSLEAFVNYNFDPGFMYLFEEICGLNKEEIDDEYRFWLEYCKDHVSAAFSGIKEIMEEQKRNGGRIAVVSHSHREHILKEYAYNHLPEPDMVFGIECPMEERKPSPVSLYKIMEQYHLKPSQLLMIDDLKPGLVMAKEAGVPFCGAGWCFDIPKNKAYMKENADYYCESINELKKICL